MGTLAFFLELLISGLVIGSIYALIALGFVVIYKATKILNFAQGELLMLGGYVCFVLIVDLKLPYLPALLLTFAFMTLFGIVLEVTLFRKMVGKPVFSLIMITVGLSSILRSVAMFIWGDMDFTELPSPFPAETVSFLGAGITYPQISAIAATAVMFGLVAFFYHGTRIGTSLRASADDQDSAALTGVNVNRVFQLAWVMAGVIACVGGIVLGQINYLHPSMGFIAIRVFPAVILGGMESIPGCILGGLIIGLSENFVGGLIGHGIQDVTAYIILILVLLIRPYGLFGIKEIERV